MRLAVPDLPFRPTPADPCCSGASCSRVVVTWGFLPWLCVRGESPTPNSTPHDRARQGRSSPSCSAHPGRTGQGRRSSLNRSEHTRPRAANSVDRTARKYSNVLAQPPAATTSIIRASWDDGQTPSGAASSGRKGRRAIGPGPLATVARACPLRARTGEPPRAVTVSNGQHVSRPAGQPIRRWRRCSATDSRTDCVRACHGTAAASASATAPALALSHCTWASMPVSFRPARTRLAIIWRPRPRR